MKGNLNLQYLAALLLVTFIALLAMGSAPAVQAANPNTGIIPPQAHPYGHTYGEWTAMWWQWVMSIPVHDDQGNLINPMLDETGAYCAQGQAGPVWFLGSNMGGSTSRDCTVPPGKALLFAPLAGECSAAEPDPWHGDNEAEMRECARGWMDSATLVDISVDGVPLHDVLSDYRFQSPLYSFAFPDDNLLGLPAGTTQSVADGYFVMLAPLPVGQHTIVGRVDLGEATGSITYHLNITN